MALNFGVESPMPRLHAEQGNCYAEPLSQVRSEAVCTCGADNFDGPYVCLVYLN